MPVTAVFHLAGLDCPSEGKLVDAALREAPGVTDWMTNYIEGTVTVHLRTDADAAAAEHRLRTTGMTVTRIHDRRERDTADAPLQAERRRLLAAMVTAVVATVAGLVTGLVEADALARGCFAAAVFVGGLPTFRKALGSIRRRTIDMHVLMSIAVLGALAIGEWLEAAVVVVLFALANALESFSLDRARHAISGLLDLSPPTAVVRRDGRDETIPAEQVRVGDTIIVKAGGRLPVDGLVTGGTSEVDQSPITGESRLVAKREGDTVFAGTLNVHGVLEIQATRPAADSTPARIRHMVEKAQAHRAPVQRFVDRFAARYTPAVIALAVVVAVAPPLVQGGMWGAWFYRALVLLVIACPCALVISTPVALVSHLAAAARHGVLIKGGVHLENLAEVSAVVFDKTGTLTLGKPRVAHVTTLNGRSEGDVLRYAAAVEARSPHPLAPVICEAAQAAGLTIPMAGNSHTHPGEGLHAVVEGRDVWVGTLSMARGSEAHLAAAASAVNEHARHGETTVVVGVEDEPFGVIALADTERPEAAGVLAALRERGIAHLHMLTGDNREVAERFRAALGLDEAFSELLPEDKVTAVQRLLAAEHTVAMVGDGINDAPALAAATVGIAMGAGGSDAALEAADIALVGDDLRGVPRALIIARTAMRVVRQNIAIALGLKFGVLALALGGVATLWLAILADMGASLLVIANALRPLPPSVNVP